MELGSAPLGSEGKVDVKLEGGKVSITATHNHASGSASLVITEDAKYFLELLKKAIPGNWDDLVINMAEAALP